jgi:hypothetical protein
MFTLEEVVPYGRSFDEYRRMFALTDADLQSKILGCADGPASFNAEATHRGIRVVSCDPLYGAEVVDIRQRIAASFDQVIEQTRQNLDAFVWNSIGSVDHLAKMRMTAMEAFLDDYDAGTAQGRYVEAELPALPFPNSSFDLAVCSHFLFLYTDQLTNAFHVQSILELRRIAREVRIFPLLALGGQPSPYVESVADEIRSYLHAVTIETVPYEFQRGGNQMMRVRGRE